MSGALYHYGRTRPPKTPLRRILLGVVIFVFCASLVPLAIIQIVMEWRAHDVGGVISGAVPLLVLVPGLGASVYGIVIGVHDRRRARQAAAEDEESA